MKKHYLQGRRRFLGCIALLLSLVVLGAGCNSKVALVPTASSGKLKVAVSIVPQATFVKAVGGDLVDVVTMIPPGVEPENYAPSPQQMVQFSDAQIYFAIGVPSEKAAILPRVHDLNANLKVVDLPALVDSVYPPRLFPAGDRDPHMWLSPRRVQEIVRITAQQLANLDPTHQTTYEENARIYIASLNKLDQDIRTSLAGLTNRTFIVYHPAFGYFADDYGLKMIALEEEGKEATAINLQKVIDLAKQEHIKVIFYQAEVDSKQSRTLAAEIGGQAEMVTPLDPDYINNLEKIAQTFARVLGQP